MAIDDPQRTPDWQTACAAAVIANCTKLNVGDIIDVMKGEAINFTCPLGDLPELWGVNGTVCDKYCGSDEIVQDYSDVAEIVLTMSTWLFPFMALIAQLPFETKSALYNFYSACLALGSPALVTYSLAVTSLNRDYVHDAFMHLRDHERRNERTTREPAHSLIPALESAWFILAEVQHAPIRANSHNNELRRLVSISDNLLFWPRVKHDLLKTRRGFTYSFFAQALFAAISYLFSFVSVMRENLGNPTIGLQFATSIVWSWMFPVVFGYIYVGCQYSAGTISEALNKRIKPHEASSDKVIQGGLYQSMPHHPLAHRMDFSDSLPLSNSSPSHNALFPSSPELSGLSPIQLELPELNRLGDSPSSQRQTTISDTTQAVFPGPHTQLTDSKDIQAAPWWGHDVRGHEIVEGPIFNYARIFTWFQLVDQVQIEFQSQGASPLTPKPGGPRTYARFREVNPKVYHHIFFASVIAIILQWGTTGAAMLTAYKTPSVGLGCRSGSYLIYGCLATLSWIFLVLGSFCSHAVMVKYEDAIRDKSDSQRDEFVERKTKSITLRVLSAFAVIFPAWGKVLAIVNTAWLFSFSIMDDIGFFRNCWCETVDLANHGRTTAFPRDSQWSALKHAAKDVWGGGFAFSTVVFLGITAFFLVSTRRGVA